MNSSAPTAQHDTVTVSSRQRRLCFAWLLLAGAYVFVAWLLQGQPFWLHADFVFGGNVLWGDDAYRMFLARSAWPPSDLYFFNFILPGQLLLDGALTALSGDQLLFARMFKAALLAAGPVLLFDAVRSRTGSVSAGLFSGLTLAVAPLYVMVGLSFYGEAWVLVCLPLAIWLHARQRMRAAAVIVGLLPLFRIEGMLFLGAYGCLLIYRRQWLAAGLMVLPGFLFFLAVTGFGPGLGGFNEWRAVTGGIYRAAQTWFGGSLSSLAVLFPLLWLLALPFCLRAPHDWKWVFVLPSVAWALFGVITVAGDLARLEPRYFVGAYPGLALASGYLALWLGRSQTLRQRDRVLLLLVACALVLGQHLLSLDLVKQRLMHRVQPPASYGFEASALGWPVTTADNLAELRELADVIERMTHANPDIQMIAVGPKPLFYFLSPARLRDGVTTMFPLSSWPGLKKTLGTGKTAGYFGNAPYAGIFQLDQARPGEPQVLYIEDVGLRDYPFHWQVGRYDIFMLSYDMLPPTHLEEGK